MPMTLKRNWLFFLGSQLVRTLFFCLFLVIPRCLSLSESSTNLAHLAPLAVEMLRSIIDHKKVFVLALNGPGVGGGAAWFEGVADIVLAAQGAYLQVPFNALGLVPENGSA